MKKNNIVIITETAILVANAVVFSLISKFVPFLNMKEGGAISLSMLPLQIIALRRNIKAGLIGGFAYAIINFMIDGMVLHLGSIAFDYILPFTIMGLTGLFKNKITSCKRLICVIILFGFIRYLFHSFSGVLFFKEYAYIPSWFIFDVKEELIFIVYSFVIYNLPYMFISTVLCCIVGAVLYKNNLILDKKNN